MADTTPSKPARKAPARKPPEVPPARVAKPVKTVSAEAARVLAQIPALKAGATAGKPGYARLLADTEASLSDLLK